MHGSHLVRSLTLSIAFLAASPKASRLCALCILSPHPFCVHMTLHTNTCYSLTTQQKSFIAQTAGPIQYDTTPQYFSLLASLFNKDREFTQLCTGIGRSTSFIQPSPFTYVEYVRRDHEQREQHELFIQLWFTLLSPISVSGICCRFQVWRALDETR